MAPLAGVRPQPGADRHQAQGADDGDHRRDTTASLVLAFEVAGYFEIPESKARAIAAEVAAAVSKWRTAGGRHGISRQEIDRMASAFEHRDLEIACGP